MDNKETAENPVRELLMTMQQLVTLDRLGGRESFFGMMNIFEIILKEEHEKDPDEPKEGMYRFHGMEQYGNIVSIKCAFNAVKICVEEYKFTKDEFDQLMKWYKGRESVDCATLYVAIKWAIKTNKYFE